MNLDKKYILVSNRWPDINIWWKEHKAKWWTKNAYKFLFDNFCTHWFFILSKDFYSNENLWKFNPIFIDNKNYYWYYYKYISEYLYLYLLWENNKHINFLEYISNFNFVNKKIINSISNYENIILCDYHLYNIPKNLSWKNIIYFWFIPFLEIKKYKNTKTIKEIVHSLSFCKKIIFLNKVYLKNFEDLYKHFFPNKVLKTELIINLLWADNFFVEHNIYPKSKNIIKLWMISRLDPIKNILNVIKSYELFLKNWRNNVEFEILAEYHRQDSIYYKKYEDKILKKLENFNYKDRLKVKFWSFDKNQIKKFYMNIDVFVCLSFYDWMPLTVLEFILSNKNNNKNLLLSENIWSYDLLKNFSRVIRVNPYSINEIKNWFLKILNKNMNMNKLFKKVSENTLQNWGKNNFKILNENRIILLWSWDTLWIPVVWCNCEVCQAEKRTRFWIYISYNWKNILIDANPDLKWQFLENKLDYKNIDYIFVTHTHTDHINWLWELNFRKKLKVFHPTDEINKRNMNYFNYLQLEKVIEKVPFEIFEEIILEENIKIQVIPLNHWFPTCWFVIFLWKIKIWIMSDTNLNLEKNILKNFENCDFLFVDWFSENLEQVLWLYKQIWEEKTLKDLEKIWFHTSIEELKNLKELLNPKNLIVVHISHIAWKHNNLQEKYKDFIIWKDWLKFDF